MRLKTFILCTTSAGVIAFGATPALSQQTPPEDQPQQAQEQPADPEAGAAQTDDAVQSATGADEVPEEEAIVVTGFRESLASTRNIKRNSEQIVDAIVAEDIGKLPDLAVSDTAARIPGVQVVRTGGEASSVLIRGLPDFTTTYNGREIFTAETRVVALQDFPSANIAALEVFKATTAPLVEAGLAGLVNVRSRRPFDFKDLEIAGSVWGLYTNQSGEVTPNGNFLISNRWDTGIGEVGLLVNVSYTQLKFLDSEPSNTDFIADPVINGQRVRFPDIQRLFYREGNRTRPSVNAAMQWRPSDSFELYGEFLYQGFRNRVSDRLLAPVLFGGTYSNLVFREGTNQLSSGTVTNPGDNIFSFQGGTFNKTNTYQYAIGGRYEAGPLTLTADLARTETQFTGSTESVDRRYCTNGYTVDFDLETPQFTIRNCDLTNPANQVFNGLFEEAQVAQGDDYQARFDAEYEFDEGFFLRSIQAGVRYTDRGARREFGNRFSGFDAGRGIPITALPLDLELARRGFRGTNVQSGTETFLVPTYRSIRDNRVELRRFVMQNNANFGFPADGRGFTITPVAPNPTSTYDASEETLAGYGQLNYRIGDDFIDGAIGLRAVRTKVGVRGTASVQGVPTPVFEEQEFTDYLPNASIRFRFTPQIQLRLSATQTRTRPTFAQLNPSVDVGAPVPDTGPGGGGTLIRRGSGGNPFLEPFTSDNYDASLEYYFSRTGFAAVTIFRRDLQGFIQNQTVRREDPTLGLIEVTAPVNARGGRIDGLEAQVSTFFDFEFLPDFLRNFGFQANYTYLDDEVEIENPAARGTFINDRIISPGAGGLSKHTFNLTGLYEGGPFSARLTYNKRSNYLDRRDERGDEEGGFYREIANPAGRLDFSVNYTVNDNATIFFDATNLTGDPFEVNFSSARGGAPRADYVRFLRYEEQTFSLGLRFRL
jgi:TonB-dependent receptor